MHNPVSIAKNLPPLLRLPVELRHQVYAYILPSTSTFDVRLQRGTGEQPERSEYNLTFVRETLGNGAWKMQKTQPKTDRETGNDIVWRRGSIAILSVCEQVHDECADMLYGGNMFVIDVAFDSVKFRYRWRTANNLRPTQSILFLTHFSQRNLMRIKNYVINVEHVDDYTGMIKYNTGGRGLTAGIRDQVQNLVDLLSVVPYLHRLHIHLIDGAISRIRFPSGRVHRVQDEKNFSQSQTVLDPFCRLYGVRNAKVTGVSAEYTNALEKSMTDSRGVPPSHSRRVERREDIEGSSFQVQSHVARGVPPPHSRQAERREDVEGLSFQVQSHVARVRADERRRKQVLAITGDLSAC